MHEGIELARAHIFIEPIPFRSQVDDTLTSMGCHLDAWSCAFQAISKTSSRLISRFIGNGKKLLEPVSFVLVLTSRRERDRVEERKQ